MTSARIQKPEVRPAIDLCGLIDKFGSEERCRHYLEGLRWPEGVKCPRCQSAKISRIAKRDQFDCDSCRFQFSVTAGTIFHDTHLPLWKWLLATYMMSVAKKGVSANQLKRTLGVSYKTAWYLCHRIRASMQDANRHVLSGTVEVDETYIGGKRRDVGRGNYRDYKTAVVGAVQRGGNIRMKVIGRVTQKNVLDFINAAAEPGARAIYTDEAPIYEKLPNDMFQKHEAVNHSEHEYVRADVHTNTVESVWSLLKRSIVGSYHQLSTKHLPAYLDEIAFRFNNRENPFLFRDTLLKLLAAEAMPFKALVKNA